VQPSAERIFTLLPPSCPSSLALLSLPSYPSYSSLSGSARARRRPALPQRAPSVSSGPFRPYPLFRTTACDSTICVHPVSRFIISPVLENARRRFSAPFVTFSSVWSMNRLILRSSAPLRSPPRPGARTRRRPDGGGCGRDIPIVNPRVLTSRPSRHRTAPALPR